MLVLFNLVQVKLCVLVASSTRINKERRNWNYRVTFPENLGLIFHAPTTLIFANNEIEFEERSIRFGNTKHDLISITGSTGGVRVTHSAALVTVVD